MNTVSKVEVDGISVPEKGGFPSYVAITHGGMELKEINNTNFSNGIAWFDKTTGKYVPVRTGIFEAGHEYLVEMYLVPSKGYVFDGNAKATVNGKKANVVTASKNEFYITYGFEAVDEVPVMPEMEVLDQASVVKIIAPKAGEAPSYDAITASDAYGLKDEKDRDTKNGITWKNETTGKPMLVGIDKFEAGNEYSVTVGVNTKENYPFLTDSNDKLDIDGYINGKKAKVSGRNETEAYLTLPFEKLPVEEVLEVPEVPVGPETPVTPQKQSNFTDVKAGAYYETPVQWAVANGITSGTSKTTFSPADTCTRGQIVTFLWRYVDGK